MSAIIFAYVTLFTLLIGGAAAAAESAVRGRGRARHVWTAAIVLSILAPAGAIGVHASGERSVAAGTQASRLSAAVIGAGRSAVEHGASLISRNALIRLIAPSERALRNALAAPARGAGRIAPVAWICFSLALILGFVVGELRWRHAQRSWRQAILDGVSVDISSATGPAVVGFTSHRIVLPEWAITMPTGFRRLVLAHECEHIGAHDPERLMFAIVALIAMPWNVGLWWCAARLRRAIELDCDARVLRRYPGAKEYGSVLLEVASRTRIDERRAVPAVAFLELPSQLEMRIRAMTSARSAGLRGAVIAGVVALAATVAAFATPIPALRSGRTGAPAAATLHAMRAQPRGKADSAKYFSFSVDKPAHLLPGTSVPKYPEGLKQAGVRGMVEAEFVVDTAGHVEPETIRIRGTTNPGFAQSVRAALPSMKFAPAQTNGRRIRQIVQMPFTFALAHAK